MLTFPMVERDLLLPARKTTGRSVSPASAFSEGGELFQAGTENPQESQQCPLLKHYPCHQPHSRAIKALAG